MEQYFICAACNFQFKRTKQPNRCPDCGKYTVQEATEEEKQKFIKTQSDKHLWED